MSRFTNAPSTDYRAHVTQLREYAATDQEPRENVICAIGEALDDDLRKRFQDYWGVDEAADTACLRRIITSEEACTCEHSWIDREHELISSPGKPPHSPPYADHATLWLDAGTPVLYSMHVSPPAIQTASSTGADTPLRNGWVNLVRFAEHWGLELGVTPFSWYSPFTTVNVVFYLPDWQ